MPKILCHSCKNPVQGTAWPQKRPDYPDCWVVPDMDSDLKAILSPKNGNNMVLICSQCRALWYIFWNQRDAFLEAVNLPAEFQELLTANITSDRCLDLLRSYPLPGPIQSFLLSVLWQRFAQKDLQANAVSLLHFLSDTSLSLKTAEAAVSLLHTVLSEAVKRAFPGNITVGASTRDELAEKLREQVQGTETLLEAAYTALEKLQRERPLQHLPPLRNLDISPLETWLSIIPEDSIPISTVLFREGIRELLMIMARQAHRRPPVLTVTDHSAGLLERFNNLDKWYAAVTNTLKQFANNHPGISELDLADVLQQLERLILTGRDLDADTAINLVTLCESFDAGPSRSGKALAAKIDQILLSIKKPKKYPARVQKRLVWTLKNQRGIGGQYNNFFAK